MTAPDDRLDELGVELTMLKMLEGRVKDELEARRLELARLGTAGETKLPQLLVNNRGSGKPVKAGDVRVDFGRVTVRVTDETAFRLWVQDTYPENILMGGTRTTAYRPPTGPEADALSRALVPTMAHVGFDREAVMHRALYEAGWQLTPVPADERVPDTVDPKFTERVLDQIKKNAKADGEPGPVETIDGAGLLVEGVTATLGDPIVVITPTKDENVAGRYIRTHSQTLLALSGAITDDEEN